MRINSGLTNQYLGPDNGRAGTSISGWITGTAGWMFRAIIEFMAGIHPSYDGFTVNPCLPSIWPSINVKRPLRGKTYDINVCRSGNSYNIKINGVDYNPGNTIAYN